ncbi:MAG TPA: YidC/Oxa1 family membrane protein insertase [Solirubrobacteraceae bacterium]|nr:YidC/Oxa1 family membrane protein insertase [Solirubrobacteraceae bacterium]
MFITGYIPVFKQLIAAFDAVIRFFHDSIGLSWGLSIIALTVCVRAVLLPLTIKQFKSMQALQRLAPEIKKLQEKYKEDKQRLNQEMMRFYQENKVNPFASCLPLLMQMPVFVSLFYMLRKDLKVDICGPKERILQVAQEHHTTLQNIGCDKVVPGSAKFGFIGDLTHSATGATLVILLVLYVGSQLASSLLMSVTADKNQRTMMLALPFVFVIFVHTFPAGLLVYWITTNLWTVGQQYLVRRTVGHMPPPTAGGGDGGDGGKPAARAPQPSGDDDGGGAKKQRQPAPAAAAVVSGSGGPPPRPPRKKKKRSGRRR